MAEAKLMTFKELVDRVKDIAAKDDEKQMLLLLQGRAMRSFNAESMNKVGKALAALALFAASLGTDEIDELVAWDTATMNFNQVGDEDGKHS